MTSAILKENCGYSPSTLGLLGKLEGLQSYKVQQSHQQLQNGRECHGIPKSFLMDIEPSRYDIPKPLGEHADPRTIQIVHQISDSILYRQQIFESWAHLTHTSAAPTRDQLQYGSTLLGSSHPCIPLHAFLSNQASTPHERVSP